MTYRVIALTGVFGMAALVHGLVLLAQIVTPSGRYIPVEQWRKDLDASKPALGIVAGQTATILPNVATCFDGSSGRRRSSHSSDRLIR